MELGPIPPKDTLQSAHSLAAAGDYAEAFARIERVLRAADGSVPPSAVATALAAVARSAERKGDAAMARRALTAALERVDWADLHLAMGTLLVRDGEGDAARRAFDRALAINPGYRAAALERALLDAREGRISEALGALRALTGGGPEGESEALREGLARLREAAVEDAAPLLRLALTGGDEALERLLGDAEASLAAGDVGSGLRMLRRAVAERPGYADLHALLGAHELRAGCIDDGLASLVHALELNPDFHAARIELARGLEARGEREAALHEVQQVLEADPARPDAVAFYERLTVRRRGPALLR